MEIELKIGEVKMDKVEGDVKNGCSRIEIKIGIVICELCMVKYN